MHLTRTRSKIGTVGQYDTPSSMRGGLHDVFVNIDGALEIAVRSNKPKAVALVKWLSKKGVEKIQEIQIEEKDAAIALLNDDLEDVGKQLVHLEHENCDLQNEVERLEERYVPRLQNTKLNNSMVIVQKNNGDEYGYVAICGQQGYVTQKINHKLIQMVILLF